MLKLITTWHERFKDKLGNDLIRQRAFKYDANTREIVDFEDYTETSRFPLDVMAEKDFRGLSNHYSRVLVKFAQKEVRNGNNNN